jgi:hypothetical protein
MEPLADNQAHLLATGAFVIQLQSGTAVEQGQLVGRDEHVVS